MATRKTRRRRRKNSPISYAIIIALFVITLAVLFVMIRMDSHKPSQDYMQELNAIATAWPETAQTVEPTPEPTEEIELPQETEATAETTEPESDPEPVETPEAELTEIPADTDTVETVGLPDTEPAEEVVEPAPVDIRPAPEVEASEPGETPAPAIADESSLFADATEEIPSETDDNEASKGYQTLGEIVEISRPNNSKYGFAQKIYENGKQVSSYSRTGNEEIHMGSDKTYTELEGITCFRGNNYRSTGSYGTISSNPTELKIMYTKKNGGIDSWSGVGWTGQPSIVKWPKQVREQMNIYDSKRFKEDLVEVIYATLDGKIYFFDLEDGEPTRDPIKIGAPIKGSVTVDPRGYPLLYCGQGIEEVHGKNVKIGFRIFSLIDGSVLFFLDGHDKCATRHWYACDCSPLVDAETDTLLEMSENGLLYRIKLNTNYDSEFGTISIDPAVDRYWYKSKITTRPGIENSLSIYNNYAYFNDNSGLVSCVDLNTLECKWVNFTGDDSDASIVVEEEDDGFVALYTACECDLQTKNSTGKCYIQRFNALTGESMWKVAYKCQHTDNAGAFATPALGKNDLSDMIIFNISKTTTNDGGTLVALNKKTGEVIWERSIKAYSWSSPVIVYDENGKGYVIVGNCRGILRILDGRTGEQITYVDLDANIEASPAVYNDMLVVGTRGSRIFGIKIK